MAVYLTNGKYFIAHDSAGKLIKVDNMENAQDFHSVERAVTQKNKHKKKCAGYYIDDTEQGIMELVDGIVRRKSFSADERLQIYRKTEGHCYLCGEFVDFDKFEIEHCLPLAKGGTNDFDNLFCACHTCNSIKQSIHPLDFMERITKIYLYQMGNKVGNSLRWKIVHRLLTKMV